MLTGRGPTTRNEIYYLTESTVSAVRIGDWKYRLTDQPDGWIGATQKLDAPILTNLRLDPFERMQWMKGRDGSWGYGMDFYIHEFWRFVFLQQEVAKELETFVEFPPLQRGASFNLAAVKAQVEAAVEAAKRAHQ
jgi:arylsulfatase